METAIIRPEELRRLLALLVPIEAVISNAHLICLGLALARTSEHQLDMDCEKLTRSGKKITVGERDQASTGP